MKERQSGMARFFKGKLYPTAAGNASPVKDITVVGGTRFVKFSNGEILKQTKAQAVKAFNAALSAEQHAKAIRGIRATKGGVKATVGGSEKGERRTYSSKGRAVAALNKIYGQ